MNERITASTFEAAIDARKNGKLKKINIIYFMIMTVIFTLQDGSTVLMYAPQSGNLEMVKYLHSLGADLNSKDQVKILLVSSHII